MPEHIDYDPVSLAILISSLIFSPKVSVLVGPYIIIWVGSTVGAYLSLSAKKVETRRGGIMYFLSMNGIAMIATVPISMLVRSHVSQDIEVRWVLGIVALVLGGVGFRWPTVLMSIVRFVAPKWLEAVLNRGSKNE